MKTVVIGLGNPLLTDDGAGVKAARALRDLFPGDGGVSIVELSAGGLRLLDAMTGFDRAIILDAMSPSSNSPGAIHRLSLAELGATWNTASLHDMNLPTALAFGAVIGVTVPTEVVVFGIEGSDMETFGEEPTHAVSEAIPALVDLVCRELHGSVNNIQREAV